MIGALVIPFLAMSVGALAGFLVGSLLAIGRLSRLETQLGIAVQAIDTVARKSISDAAHAVLADARARIKEAGE